MSCPDWRHLDPDLDAPRWQAALHHLDTGCRTCWQQALAADPTLIFRRLPVPALGPADEADEVAAARMAVAAMRTASRNRSRGASGALAALAAMAGSLGEMVQGGGRRAGRVLAEMPSVLSGGAADRDAFHGARRWALAASLTALALLCGSDRSWHGIRYSGADSGLAAIRAARPQAASVATDAGLTPAAAGAAVRPVALPYGRLRPGAAGDAMPAADRSSIEGLSRPGARVYQIDGPQMSVVMIVDEKLDV